MAGSNSNNSLIPIKNKKGPDHIKERPKWFLKKNEKAKHVWQAQICIRGLMPKYYILYILCKIYYNMFVRFRLVWCIKIGNQNQIEIFGF